MKVDVRELQNMLALRDRLNSARLSEIEFSYGGAPVNIDPLLVSEFERTGLSNLTFCEVHLRDLYDFDLSTLHAIEIRRVEVEGPDENTVEIRSEAVSVVGTPVVTSVDLVHVAETQSHRRAINDLQVADYRVVFRGIPVEIEPRMIESFDRLGLNNTDLLLSVHDLVVDALSTSAGQETQKIQIVYEEIDDPLFRGSSKKAVARIVKRG